MENVTDKRGIGAITERGVKVAISMLWYSGAQLSRGLMRLAGRSPSPRFVVLYYHEVPEEVRARFARQMEALSRGTTVVRAAHTHTQTRHDHIALLCGEKLVDLLCTLIANRDHRFPKYSG